MPVKPQTLAALIMLYALAGSLLALSTRDTTQQLTAAVTGMGVALVLGAAWPVHRGFPVAGMVIGLTLGSAFLLYTVIWLALNDGRAELDRPRMLVLSWQLSLAVYGAWTFLMTLGLAATWLIRSVRPRPTIVNASS